MKDNSLSINKSWCWRVLCSKQAKRVRSCGQTHREVCSQHFRK